MSTTNYAFDANDLSVGAVKKLMDDVYRPQYQSNVKLLRLLEKQTEDATNVRKREFTVALTQGSRTTGRPAAGLLPLAMPVLEARGEYGYAILQKAVSFDWVSLKHMARSDATGAMVTLNQRLAQHMKKFESDSSYFAYGDGSGALAVGTTVAGTGPYTLTLTNTTDTFGGAGSNGTARLNRNEEIDVVVAASVQAVVQVVDILSATTCSVNVISGSLSAGALSFILAPPGSRPSGFNGVSYMPHGLAYNIPGATTTEFWTLNPSTSVELRSLLVDMAGAEMTVGFANFLEDAARHRRPEEEPEAAMGKTKIIWSVGQARKIKQGMNSIRRADMATKTYVLGAQHVANQWGNVWDEDPGCPDSRAFNIYLPTWKVAKLADVEYVDEGEGMWHLRPANSTSVRGNFYAIYDGWTSAAHDYVNTDPFMQAMFTGIGTATIQTASQYAHGFA